MKKELFKRLINYRNVILKMKELGFMRVFSGNLADAIGVNPVIIRKDFSFFGIKGNYKAGYDIDYLLKKIDDLLYKDKVEKVIIIGAGNIGSALMKYKGFEKVGIKIVGCFDIDPSKINPNFEIPILKLEDIKSFIEKNSIKICILCVPEVAAQRVADLVVSCGIKGILNFAPIKLKVNNCIVCDVHIETELENLVYLVKTKN